MEQKSNGLPKEGTEVRVKNTPTFGLKDKHKKHYQAINLKKQFGFLPEVIIVEKMPGKKIVLVVRAVMTPEALAAEKKLRAKIISKK